MTAQCASLDRSWCSKGSTQPDGTVAAISLESGKVVNVVSLNSSCHQCTKNVGKKEKNSISSTMTTVS